MPGLQVTATGRHRYCRIATGEVARLIENLMQVAGADAPARPAHRTGPTDEALRRARCCYDHVAGRLGVAIADKLATDGAVVVTAESGWVTEHAAASLAALDFDVATALDAGTSGRAPCRPCMDWSERRIHLAGRLGAALCEHCLGRGWLRRRSKSRALDITPGGQIALNDWLGPVLWKRVLA